MADSLSLSCAIGILSRHDGQRYLQMAGQVWELDEAPKMRRLLLDARVVIFRREQRLAFPQKNNEIGNFQQLPYDDFQ